ncbi:UNVERIFIED_CONTAM: hypothetical protein PYX00_002289 [Menopon gallinae]|uniref:FLYWCH-type domain-containing protein n=1 Tax=Menopon gallinae TaxID=328185 RepID=A0AAW2IG62_9NEOP
MYTKHKSFNNVTRWRCAYRGRCRGSIMTSNDFTQPVPKMAHTHPADYKACEMAKARYLIPKVNNFVFKEELFELNGEYRNGEEVLFKEKTDFPRNFSHSETPFDNKLPNSGSNAHLRPCPRKL